MNTDCTCSGTGFPIFNNDVVLRFGRNELLYDIKNYAYIEWDVTKVESAHDKHMIADIGEKGNVDRVTRVLDLTFAQCVELLYPYAKREVKGHSSRDNELEEEEEYVLRMKVPDTFSETTVTLLEKLIHELMVCAVLADWFSITKPDIAASWAARVEALETEIRRVKNRRSGRLTRKLHPF
jgi:hypothetical protein